MWWLRLVSTAVGMSNFKTLAKVHGIPAEVFFL